MYDKIYERYRDSHFTWRGRKRTCIKSGFAQRQIHRLTELNNGTIVGLAYNIVVNSRAGGQADVLLAGGVRLIYGVWHQTAHGGRDRRDGSRR